MSVTTGAIQRKQTEYIDNLISEDITTEKITIDGNIYVNSATASSLSSGTTVVFSLNNTEGTSFFVDYWIKSSSNLRAGTVIAVWNSTTDVEYTDISTKDIGDTSAFSFTVSISGTNIILNAVVTSSIWECAAGVRII